jgi:hypothetical protein
MNDGTHPPMPPLTAIVGERLSTPARAPTIMPRNPYARKAVPSTTMTAAQSLLSLNVALTPMKRSGSSLQNPTSVPSKRNSKPTSVVTPSPTNEQTSFSFQSPTAPSYSRPCLQRMLLDFKISESDQRGRGSHMPSHVLDAIAESDPVPATLSALRKIKHVGKVLIQKHGPSIVSICNQYVKDLTSWDFNNPSIITGADLTGALDTSKTENAIAIDSMTYLSFLRPPVPIGPVQDLFFSTCKQVLNEYNIVGKMSVDIETRPSRVQPTKNSTVASNTDDLVPSSFKWLHRN